MNLSRPALAGSDGRAIGRFPAAHDEMICRAFGLFGSGIAQVDIDPMPMPGLNGDWGIENLLDGLLLPDGKKPRGIAGEWRGSEHVQQGGGNTQADEQSTEDIPGSA